MRAKDDVEHYMLRMGLQYEEVGDGVWILHDESDTIENIVVMFKPPIVVLRLKVMVVPAGRREDLFRKLLELNSEMLHGAFAVEGENVLLVDTLEVENLDYNEFQASLDSLSMAISQFYPALIEFRDRAEGKGSPSA